MQIITCPTNPLRLAACVGLLLFPAFAAAQSAHSAGSDSAAALPEQRFEIRRFAVEGASLITREEIEAAVAPYRGASRGFADVQRALEAIERAYAGKGYNAVQVMLPEQEVARGEVRLRVIEARVGTMVIEGNSFFGESNIRASLPALTPGTAPNIHRVAENLRLANENPAKHTSVLLRSGAAEGVVDTLVRVSDEPPFRYRMTLDNTGTPQTGLLRAGLGFQHANVWNLDHVLSMQYVTAPYAAGHPSRLSVLPDRNVAIIGAGYRIPIYRWGDSVDITAGYSNVATGAAQDLFQVSGAGTVLGVKYNHTLPRWGDLEHRLGLAWDRRAFRGDDAVTVRPVGIQYAGAYRRASQETSYSVGLHRNLPGGNDGGPSAFESSRLGARPGYRVWRYRISHNRSFGNDWQLRIAFNGQATRDRVVAGEQFGIGGIDSVRGFLEREVLGDQGDRGTVEGHSPELAGLTERFSGYKLRGVLFYDWGRVSRTDPSGPNRQSIAAAGFGLRLSGGTNLSVRLDYALVLDKGGQQGRGDGRVHLTLSYRCC